MPTHVHMLIFPCLPKYNIAEILQAIKGKTSKRYREFIINNRPDLFDKFCVIARDEKIFRIWQTGGGYDRNLWNSKPIHHSINYIEANPVRLGLVEYPEDWKWSSAHARTFVKGVIPDSIEIPIYMQK
jgi:REP element-mobilizing transposase RayT